MAPRLRFGVSRTADPETYPRARGMRNQLGFLMQFAALTFLPLLVIWQLNFGFRLLWMPTLTVAAIVVFWIGHSLREPTK